MLGNKPNVFLWIHRTKLKFDFKSDYEIKIAGIFAIKSKI